VIFVAEDELFTKEDVSRIVSERLKRDREKRGHDTLMSEISALKEENQRLSEDLSSMKTENERSKITQLRARIARDTNLPEGLASRLAGTTEEEIKADAEKLKELMGPGPDVGTGSNPPQQTPKLLTRADLKAMKPGELAEIMPQIEAQLKDGTLK